MTVARKLHGALAVYVASLAMLAMYHVATMQRAVESGVALTQIAERVRVTATEQLTRVDEMSSDIEKFLVTRDSGYHEKFIDAAHAYGQELQRLPSAALSNAERAALRPLASDWQRFDYRVVRLRGVATGARTDAMATVDSLQQALEKIRVGTQQMGAASQEAMSQELAVSARAARRAARLSTVAALVALLVGVALSAALVRSIVAPLGRLAQGTREVSAGRFDYRLDGSGGDEFSRVARDFNSMTERLGELDRMKRDFTAKVSHDLKTPLSSMQETTRALLDKLAGPVSNKQRQLLEINLESGQRLSGMLGKLLDLSRIEAGIEPDFQPVDLSALARRTADAAAAAAALRGVRVLVAEPGPCVIRGDSTGISQVLENLIENATKFSPAGATVSISVADDASSNAMLLTVADEGPGIPEAEKDRVFDRFYQTEAGRAVRGRGVGLGLTICREIVSTHGGWIWVADNKPRGSIFHVLLPGLVRTQRKPVRRQMSRVAVAGVLLMGTFGCATLTRSPASSHRVDAVEGPSLVERARDSVVARARDLEQKVGALTTELQAVRARLDSAAAQSDSVREASLRLEATVRERDDQLQALRLELQRLKEIDLKPRPARRPPAIR